MTGTFLRRATGAGIGHELKMLRIFPRDPASFVSVRRLEASLQRDFSPAFSPFSTKVKEKAP